MKRRTYVMIGAHPDDADFHFGGTAIKLLRRGHRVVFVSVSDGSAGHHEHSRDEIRARRREETEQVAKKFGLEYIILGLPDGSVQATLENRHLIIRLIRSLKPDVVITHRSNDYHADHRETAQLVQDASFLLGVPHVCPDTPALREVPVIMFPWDKFQKPIPHDPVVAVQVDDVLEEKLAMLACHESQFFEWIPYVMQKEDQVPTTPEGRRQWLIDGWMIRNQIQAERYQNLIEERYGSEARDIQYAETYELSEYGRQANLEELESLFPL